MRKLQAEQRKNLLGKHKITRKTKRARRRARDKLLAKRKAIETRALNP